MSDFEVLDQIQKVVKSRKKADPKSSYVAKLFGKGREKIAQKVGEEAVELVIDAVAKNKQNSIKESADLLFHLLVLWEDMNIDIKDIIAELKERKGISGLDKKKSKK